MKLTIHSPLKPLFFRQRLTSDIGDTGYLATNLLHQFTNNQSYKIKINKVYLELKEKKKIDGKRNWALLSYSHSKSHEIGSLTLDSNSLNISAGKTTFTLTIQDKTYYIHKKFMQFRDACSLYDTDGTIVASYLKPSLMKKHVKVFIDADMIVKSALVLTLAAVVFVA